MNNTVNQLSTTGNLLSFAFESHEVRVTDKNGDPWFVLCDLLESMETKTTTTAAVESINQGLGDGFVADIPTYDSMGRGQTVIIVSEPAATYLLSRSNTEKGRQLNRFVHVEVLPSLRKTGAYAVKPLSPAELIIQQGQAMLALEHEQARLAGAVGRLEQRLDDMDGDTGYMTVTGWVRSKGLRMPLSESNALGVRASKMAKSMGVRLGKVPDERFGSVRSYPVALLDEAYSTKT